MSNCNNGLSFKLSAFSKSLRLVSLRDFFTRRGIPTLDIVISPINLFRKPIISTKIVKKKFKNLDEIILFCESNPLILKALQDSNTSLFNALKKYKAGATTKSKQIRKLTISLQNYLLRMGTRTTPFRYMTKLGFITSNNVKSQEVEKKLRYITLNNCVITENNKSQIELKLTNLFLKREDNIFIENESKNNNSTIIKDTLILQWLRLNLRKWTSYSKLFRKVKVDFSVISETAFITYLNKLIQIGFICCSKAVTYEEEPVCFSSNLNVNADINKNINSAIYFLTQFLDTKQEYKGWKKLKNYFSENYLFERIPLRTVAYSDEFNFWNNDDIEFHRGSNYQLLENYITSQIIQNKTKIKIPEKVIGSMKCENHHNISGDLLANVVDNKLILDSGIGSSCDGKIIGRFIKAYPLEAKEKVVDFLQNSSSGNEINAEVRYLFKNSKFASISNNINPYDYEINLNNTKDDSKQELNIESLSVGLDDQGIYLWSEDLHRKVKPKFTNAINGLAVKNKMYRFLFFLSRERYEDFKPVLPEYLEKKVWSPRLEYKNVIIRREQWKLDTQFMVEKDKDFKKAINDWRSRYNVPKIIGVSLGEAPTIFDLSNELQLKTLKKIIRKSNSQVSFVEVPELSEFHKNKIIQGVFSFYIANSKDKEISQDVLSEYRRSTSKMTYANGFLSFILYPSLFEKNNVETINEVLKRAGIRKNYFFIQYNDDEKPSLRLRVWQADEKILVSILKILNYLLHIKLINDFKLVNFRAEYSRYGGESLFNDVLKVFECDSNLALKTINMSKEKIKLLAILSAVYTFEKADVDFDYLAKFILTRDQKISKHSSVVSQLFSFEKESPILDSQNIDNYADTILKYLNKVKDKYSNYKPKYYSVLVSLLHMHFNRFLKPTQSEERQLNLDMLEYEKVKSDRKKYGQNRTRD